MSDEQNIKTDEMPEWSMPEPVFRSTEGRKPGERRPFEDSQADIPTEPGFADDENDDRIASPAEITPQKKSGGCLSTLLSIVGVLALVVVALVGLVVYFLFFYRPADRGTF